MLRRPPHVSLANSDGDSSSTTSSNTAFKTRDYRAIIKQYRPRTVESLAELDELEVDVEELRHCRAPPAQQPTTVHPMADNLTNFDLAAFDLSNLLESSFIHAPPEEEDDDDVEDAAQQRQRRRQPASRPPLTDPTAPLDVYRQQLKQEYDDRLCDMQSSYENQLADLRCELERVHELIASLDEAQEEDHRRAVKPAPAKPSSTTTTKENIQEMYKTRYYELKAVLKEKDEHLAKQAEELRSLRASSAKAQQRSTTRPRPPAPLPSTNIDDDFTRLCRHEYPDGEIHLYDSVKHRLQIHSSKRGTHASLDLANGRQSLRFPDGTRVLLDSRQRVKTVIFPDGSREAHTYRTTEDKLKHQTDGRDGEVYLVKTRWERDGRVKQVYSDGSKRVLLATDDDDGNNNININKSK